MLFALWCPEEDGQKKLIEFLNHRWYAFNSKLTNEAIMQKPAVVNPAIIDKLD